VKVLAAIAIALVLLTGATSTSRQTYILVFASDEATSPALRGAAREALKQAGFAPATIQSGVTDANALQLPGRAIWAEIQSPAPRTLTVAFTELRGGCSNFSEIAEAKVPFSRAREALERQFGPSELSVSAEPRKS
jgi:hypothetical protein